MGARQLTQSSPRGARRGREKRGAASLHTLKLSAATQRSLRRYCAGDGAQSCVDRLQRMSRLDFGRRALWSSQRRSPPRQRTPRACARRGRAEYEGSSLRRADDSAAPAESVKNMEAARRGPPIRCRSPRPFRRHQLTAPRADAQRVRENIFLEMRRRRRTSPCLGGPVCLVWLVFVGPRAATCRSAGMARNAPTRPGRHRAAPCRLTGRHGHPNVGAVLRSVMRSRHRQGCRRCRERGRSTWWSSSALFRSFRSRCCNAAVAGR